ncbi:hypothetical protein VTJ49DRAFT_2050 [Mycothermus thermophilus]|uniref:Vacuolar sorting protein Vps3844 C-terminal domain-containing protein n=1 Tax=Humicola insolens TaxID=85995 RepID=A0ABR3VAR6_HUMIN
MRLLSSLAAAVLPVLVASANPSADVYLFPKPSTEIASDVPSIPKEVARHVFLQRTSRQRYGSDLRDLPSSIDSETAITHIARFGKSPAPLFASQQQQDASQLVVILEGATLEQSRRLQRDIGNNAAFAISDPPSATANNNLLSLFRSMGIASPRQCDLASAINPLNSDCWTGSSSVVKYDLQKTPETLDALLSNLDRLNNLVSEGLLEVLLLVLPESSRNSKTNHWSATAAAELRCRRDTEAVLSDAGIFKTDIPKVAAGKPASTAPKQRIPKCFPSLNSCRNQTNSCSGHGECVDKYAVGGGSGNNSVSAADSDSPARCFVCQCRASEVERPADARTKGRRTVHWGGAMCQKEDVSVQFWLLAGFTIVMIGVVSGAISLLYSVGEEKLPGVIGAGVSRSKEKRVIIGGA